MGETAQAKIMIVQVQGLRLVMVEAREIGPLHFRIILIAMSISYFIGKVESLRFTLRSYYGIFCS